MIAGVLGVPGMSAGPSLVGMSGVTGGTSRVIGFAAAIVLLVFGFSPKLSGKDSSEAIASAIAFLRDKTQAWKLAAGLIDTSTAQAREVIDYMVKHHSHHSEGQLRAVYDGLELRVEIIYQGSPAAHVPALRHVHSPITGELEDEESAAYVGLRNFLQGFVVDRQQIKARWKSVVVRLY